MKNWGNPLQQPESPLQKKVDGGEVQAPKGFENKGLPNVPAGSKTQMPAGVQAKMESSFGTDFGNVNIHQNDASATNMGALAYTRGNNVHFAPGQYSPDTQKGQELLGHELTHVVQQREGRVKSMPKLEDMRPTVVKKQGEQIKAEQQRKETGGMQYKDPAVQLKINLKYNPDGVKSQLARQQFNNYAKGQLKQLKRDRNSIRLFNSKKSNFERALIQRRINYGSDDYVQLAAKYFPDFDATVSLPQVDSSPALEHEADVMGKKAAEGKSASIGTSTAKSIQKQEINRTNNPETNWSWSTPVNEVQSNDSVSGTGVLNVPNTYEVLSQESGSITITLYDNESTRTEHTLTRNVSAVRNYMTDHYNWNAIIKIMKYVSENVDGFEYEVPSNLTGTVNDNELIMPLEGVLGIVRVQLQSTLEANEGEITADNINTIIAEADGAPGANFATTMGEASQNTLREEAGNTNMQKEDGSAIELPDFGSDSEATLYDFMRDITLARNGLWSDEDNIVNLTGLRRELEISEEEDHNVQWNDTMAASWIETDDEGNEIKHCKHYTATTEPGNRDTSRMLRPQTATVLLGLHSSRQPAGRTKNILAQDSDNSGNGLTFSPDRGMNLHPGGMSGYSSSEGSSNLRGGMVVTPGALSGMAGSNGATTETQISVQLRLSKLFYILSKYGINRNKSAYNHLKDMRDNSMLLQSQSITLTTSQEDSITDFNTIENILNNNEYTNSRKNYIKNIVKFDKNREEDILDGDANTEPNISTNNLNDNSLEVSTNVSQSSEGCQVVYGGGNFYDYWWNSVGKSELSGQRRWYYTLINITNPYNEIETQEGELHE